jgi:serine/threonine protein kinase
MACFWREKVLEYSAQVADILRYLHLCNVVHRDIKVCASNWM